MSRQQQFVFAGVSGLLRSGKLGAWCRQVCTPRPHCMGTGSQVVTGSQSDQDKDVRNIIAMGAPTGGFINTSFVHICRQMIHLPAGLPGYRPTSPTGCNKKNM